METYEDVERKRPGRKPKDTSGPGLTQRIKCPINENDFASDVLVKKQKRTAYGSTELEKGEEDGDFVAFSKQTHKKIVQKVTEGGIRRSSRAAATKRVKYADDDSDEDEFNESSSDEQTKKSARTAKKGRGRPKGSKNLPKGEGKSSAASKNKNNANQREEVEDSSIDSNDHKIEKFLGRRLNDTGEVEYCVKFQNFSYLHLKWLTYSEMFEHSEMTTRQMGLMAAFDRLVDEEGEEKWNGDVDPDLTKIDRIVAEKQVFIPDKTQGERESEESGDVDGGLGSVAGGAHIVSQRSLLMLPNGQSLDDPLVLPDGRRVRIALADQPEGQAGPKEAEEEKPVQYEVTFRGARLGLILQEKIQQGKKRVVCSDIDQEFKTRIDIDSGERAKIEPGDIIVNVAGEEMPQLRTTLGMVIGAIQRHQRPLTLTFERPLKQKNQWSAANARKEAAAKQKRRNGQLKNMLLVKWKDQPYKLATWEFEEDINDDLKVSRFRTNQIPPTNFQTALQKTKSAALQRKKEKRRREKESMKDYHGIPGWLVHLSDGVNYDVAVAVSRLVDEVDLLSGAPDGWSIVRPAQGKNYIWDGADTKQNVYYHDIKLENLRAEGIGEEDDEDDPSDEDLNDDDDDGDYSEGVAETMLKRFVPYKKSPIYKSNLRLRDYQVQGVNWVLKNWYGQRGCILADEMGLGKTCQVVATLEHLRAVEGIRGPFLIVAPLSTIGHWKREIETWTDMNLCVYYDQGGGAKGREIIREHEWRYQDNTTLRKSRSVSKFNILLTTYETVIADLEYIGTFRWQSVVVDEGHRLKNPRSKLSQLMRPPYIRADHRLLLTGTPIQNNLQELWALLNFVQPADFRSEEYFQKEYGDITGASSVDKLRGVMGPYILRRLKHEVETAIPPRQETIIDVELTTLQKQYYRAIFDKNREFLYHGCHGNVPALLNVDMQLRKCCNHPFLIDGVEAREEERIRDAVEQGLSMKQLADLDDEEAQALAQARAEGHDVETEPEEKTDEVSKPSTEDDPTPPPPPPTKPRGKLTWTVEHIDPSFYDTYEGDWCRYCGARAASNFNRGPWGPRMLCTAHYVHWYTKKSLSFADYPIAPTRPINPAVNTEFKWKAFLAQKDEREDAAYEHRAESIIQRRKRTTVSDFQEMPGCEVVLRKIADKDIAWVFLLPVDLEAVPDYKDHIRRPMDFSTIWARLKGHSKSHYYGNHNKFAKDMRLVFRNCIQYNEEGSEICMNAERLLDEFEDMYSEYVVNTARRKFDDIIAKLPELPVEWVDLDQGVDANDKSVEGEVVNKKSLGASIKQLKKRAQKLRSRLHRIDHLNRQILADETVVPTDAQQDELEKRVDYAHELKSVTEELATTEKVSEDRVWRATLQRMVDCCGKMVFVDKLLPKLRMEGHKVLIFSQFKIMLDILGAYLKGRGYAHERLDGSVHGHERQLSIDRFNTDPNTFAFLLSTRAGGVGINLTAADTVIIYDSDWNPQNDLQALARCHRIGQTKEVTVYRLITRRSYEAQMFHKASVKLGLERAVMSGTAHGESSVFGSARDEDGALSLSLGKEADAQELEKLLREGAFAMLENNDSREFSEATIEHILSTRSRDVTYKDGESAGFSSGTTNAKHTFTSAEADSAIDVDDPDFWSLVMPGVKSARELMARLNDGTAIESEESKTEFVNNLRELVDELLQAKQNGEDVSPSEWETCKKLVLQVSCMKSTFKKLDLEAAEFWRSSMEGSRLRNRPGASSSSNTSKAKSAGADDSDSSDEDDWDKPKRRGGKRKLGSKANKREPKQHAEKSYEDFCSLCLDGGQLLICDGPCMRTFHPECVNLSTLPDGDRWECPDCSSKQHLCTICGNVGRDMPPNALRGIVKGDMVFCCNKPRCGRFYHPKCLKEYEGDCTQWNGRPGNSSFACPLHRCRECNSKLGNSNLLRCTRCPDSYHMPCIDLDHSMRVNRYNMVCPKHFEDGRKFDWGASGTRIVGKKRKMKGLGRRKSIRSGSGPRKSYAELEEEEEEESKSESETESESDYEDDTQSKKPKGPAKKAKIIKDISDPIDTSVSITALEQAGEELPLCSFCEQAHNATQIPGPFLEHPFVAKRGQDGSVTEYTWVHRACADLSPLVFVDELQRYCKVLEEVKRGKKLKCSMETCGRKGATIGCLVSKCPKSVHATCALETGWTFSTGTSAYLCPDHRPRAIERAAKAAFELAEKEKWDLRMKRAEEKRLAVEKKAKEAAAKNAAANEARRSSRVRTAVVPLIAESNLAAPPVFKMPDYESQKKKKPNLFCLCQIKDDEDKGSFWLGCENCGNWFHPKCVGLPTHVARKIAEDGMPWLCPECHEEEGQFGLKAVAAPVAPGSAEKRPTVLKAVMGEKKTVLKLSC
jgi:SNF2 family DNA or RNA helicase